MPLCKEDELELLRESGYFDAEWYLQQYPDVAVLQMDPVEHYLWLGARLGRSPSARFDARSYLRAHADVQKARVNPLLHYLRHGQREQRRIFSVPDGEA